MKPLRTVTSPLSFRIPKLTFRELLGELKTSMSSVNVVRLRDKSATSIATRPEFDRGPEDVRDGSASNPAAVV